MCVPNLVPIGPQTATCIRLEGYTHTHARTHVSQPSTQHPRATGRCPWSVVQLYRQHKKEAVDFVLVSECTTPNHMEYISMGMFGCQRRIRAETCTLTAQANIGWSSAAILPCCSNIFYFQRNQCYFCNHKIIETEWNTGR